MRTQAAKYPGQVVPDRALGWTVIGLDGRGIEGAFFRTQEEAQTHLKALREEASDGEAR